MESEKTLAKLFGKRIIESNEIVLQNLGLYLSRQSLSRILALSEIYQKIVPIHGNIIEFGVRYGSLTSLLVSLSGIYEPYNYTRKIIGFDTFSGFPEISKEDSNKYVEHKVGDYGVCSTGDVYKKSLEDILKCHKSNNPLGHVSEVELVKGDATKTIVEYLDKNPHTIISLAYFDFDIYKPTKECLLAILPHLTKGSIIAFDELNCPQFPGETIALKEVLDIGKYKLNRTSYASYISYIEYESFD
jgi:hypothetical protein